MPSLPMLSLTSGENIFDADDGNIDANMAALIFLAEELSPAEGFVSVAFADERRLYPLIALSEPDC